MSEDGETIMANLMNVLRETRIIIKHGHIEVQGAIAIIAMLLMLIFAKDLIPLLLRS